MAQSRGLRGSLLEEMINMSNEVYRKNGLALIQKVPTPITPINIDKETRHITLAYFEQKSTVDYIGVVQGIPGGLRSACFLHRGMESPAQRQLPQLAFCHTGHRAHAVVGTADQGQLASYTC